MYDHLNSGILKGGLEGPGLNIGLVEGFACFVLLDSVNIKKISEIVYTYYIFITKRECNNNYAHAKFT